MINSLREGTKQLHSDIEKDNIANKIMDHSISLEEYKLLLFQNYVAYKTADSEIRKFIPDHNSDKTNRLKEDLHNLGVNNLHKELEFECRNKAEAVGAAYVIEGSAMGGMLIGKEMNHCTALKSIPDQAFFNGKRSGMVGWNQYLKFIRSQDFTQEEINTATKKAQETFLLFRKAFSLQLPH